MHQCAHPAEVHHGLVPANHKLSRADEIDTSQHEITRPEGAGGRRYGQQAGDFVEDVVGVVEEEVDDLGEEALLLHRLQVLETLVHNALDDHTRGN